MTVLAKWGVGVAAVSAAVLNAGGYTITLQKREGRWVVVHFENRWIS